MKKLFVLVILAMLVVCTDTFAQQLEVEGDSYIIGRLGIGHGNPLQLVDARGDNLDDGGRLSLGNSDLSHKLSFFSGQLNDPFPHILWKNRDPLLLGTDEGGFTEKLRIASNGIITVQNRITNVTDPLNDQDAATKKYIDDIKASFAEDLLDAGLNGIVKDIDGNVYKTIKIGSQVWMAENLRTTHFNDGTAISEVDTNINWYNLTTPAYCWQDNDSAYVKLLGGLYNYYTVADTNGLNVCPAGWHVPSDTAWTQLTDYLEANAYGYEETGPDIAKSMATAFGWRNSDGAGHVGNNQGTNNSIGFAGFPGGWRGVTGLFMGRGHIGIWWSSEEFDAANAWYRLLNFSNAVVTVDNIDKNSGYSVRCVRD